MKRSEINAILRESALFLERMNFKLPPFAWWTPDDWRAQSSDCADIPRQQLGWDITDFGSSDFERVGLFLFTLRNGTPEEFPHGKTYGEKVLIVKEGQVTPTHFHFEKMEDIIVRGGGALLVQLWNADEHGDLSDTPVTVKLDAIRHELPAGSVVRLAPGESICLPPGLYHQFWGEEGSGTVLVGEVSRVNDDHADNRFHQPVGRFPEIEEDEPPLHLLVSDYPRWYSHA